MTEISMKLETDDLAVGMYVTLMDPRKNLVSALNPHSGQVRNITVEDPTLMGSVLEVLAVDIPYLVVRMCYAGKHSPRFTLDCRSVNFKKLNISYVKALMDTGFDSEINKSKEMIRSLSGMFSAISGGELKIPNIPIEQEKVEEEQIEEQDNNDEIEEK
jgi:hypothetical protein